MYQPSKIITAASLFLLLSACGGGGSDNLIGPTASSTGTSGATGGANSNPGTTTGSPSNTTGATGSTAGSTTPSSTTPVVPSANTGSNTPPTSTPPSSSTGTTTGIGMAGSADTANHSGVTAPTLVYDETARFNQPMGLRSDAGGNLYVLDFINAPMRKTSIRKIAIDGSVSTLVDLSDRSSATGLEVDAAGNVYVTLVDEILKITPSGMVSTLARMDRPGQPAIDAQGNLFVLAPNSEGMTTIRRITQAGDISTVFRGSRAADYSGLAIDAVGTLYVIARALDNHDGQARIVKISVTGEQSDFVPFILKIYPDDPGATRIANMSMDAAGNLYVAHYREHKPSPGGCAANNCFGFYESGMSIDKITPAGVTTRVRTGPPGSTGRLAAEHVYDRDYSMSYIDVGSDGNIFASYRLNHTVYRISQSGETTLIAGKSGEAGSAD